MMNANPVKVFEKRPYQENCLRALKKTFQNGALWALFVLATGLGKTYVAVQFLAWLLKRIAKEKEDLTRRSRVLVLCHQKPILRQLLKEFGEILGGDFTYEMFTSRNFTELPDVDVLFCTFQNMRGRRRRFPSRYFDVLLVDEGHHSKAESYEATIRYFEPRFRYAMTATPNRMDLRDISDLFGKPVYKKPLPQALAEKLLPKVIYKLFLEMKAATVKEALGDQKPSRAAIDRKFFDSKGGEERDREIARIIAREMQKISAPRVLVFCRTIRHCNRMTTCLIEEGCRAAAVHSDIDDVEQENRLEGLKSGQLNVLVARDVLNEGKDIPAINIVAIVRSTASLTIFEQQIGRGLRPGKRSLLVLDFVANCDRIEKIAQLVDAVRKAKQQNGKEDGNREFDSDCVLKIDDSDDLPIQVSSGSIEFDVVYKDLIRVLGSVNEWTVESGIAAFYALAKKLKKQGLSQREIKVGCNEGLCPSPGWLISRFAPKTKSLPEALVAIGLEPCKWTLESGTAAYLALAKNLGKKTLSRSEINAGSKEELCPSKFWLLQHFAPKTGRLAEALGAIGLEIKEPWTSKSGKAAFRRLARKLGKKTLTATEIMVACKDGSCPKLRWLLRTFAPRTGRLGEALRAIGFDAKAPKKGWTRKSGKAAFRRLARKLGKKTLIQPEIDAASKEGTCPCLPWLKKHWAPKTGRLAEALKAIGLRAKEAWTRNSGKAAFRKLANKLGKKTLTQREIRAANKKGICPCYFWLTKHWAPKTGRLAEALKGIGLASN